MKTCFYILGVCLVLLMNSCSIFQHEQTSNYPDKIIIYSLGVSPLYFGVLRCGDASKMDSAQRDTITQKEEISKIFQIFHDSTNYISSSWPCEARIEFDFMNKGNITEEICLYQFMSKVDDPGLMIKSGKVYRFENDGKIKSLLNKYHLARW